MKAIRFESPAALRAFRRLPAEARAALLAKVQAYAADPQAGGRAKKLVGREGVRLRAGDYRAIIEESATEISIVSVGDRRDIYR